MWSSFYNTANIGRYPLTRRNGDIDHKYISDLLVSSYPRMDTKLTQPSRRSYPTFLPYQQVWASFTLWIGEPVIIQHRHHSRASVIDQPIVEHKKWVRAVKQTWSGTNPCKEVFDWHTNPCLLWCGETHTHMYRCKQAKSWVCPTAAGIYREVGFDTGRVSFPHARGVMICCYRIRTISSSPVSPEVQGVFCWGCKASRLWQITAPSSWSSIAIAWTR